MLSSALRLISIAASLLILVSFALFAIDEAKSGSETQVQKLGDKQAGAKDDGGHSGVRKAIDDVDDALLSPFDGLVDSSSAWVNRGVPTLIGLFVYGFLLSLLANYARGGGPRSRGPG